MAAEDRSKTTDCRLPKSFSPEQKVITVRGGDVFEAHLLAKDPTARSRDYLLLAAKMVAKYAKAAHLSDSELRSVSWFAHLPEVEGDISNAVFAETNLLAGAFWSIWKRDPEAVLRLAKMIRRRLNVDRVQGQMSPHFTNYSDTKAARWKRSQREARLLKPPKNVEAFAARLREGNSFGSSAMDKLNR